VNKGKIIFYIVKYSKIKNNLISQLVNTHSVFLLRSVLLNRQIQPQTSDFIVHYTILKVLYLILILKF
jgi:hypothetical protein